MCLSVLYYEFLYVVGAMVSFKPWIIWSI